jgi:hypothetical protein
MGGKTPQPIRLDVIRRWLRGGSRDGIAKGVEIGAGTVSGILSQCRQDDAEFDLLRAVALELRERGMRVEDFAPLLRLKSLLEEKEVQLGNAQNDNPFAELKKFEEIVVSIEVLCFKAGMTTDQFFERLLDQALLADKHGISLLRLPTLIDQMKREIENLKKKTEDEVKRQGATMNLLREYQTEKPFIDSTRRQLEDAVKKRDSCQRELDYLREENRRIVLEQEREEYSWYSEPGEEEMAKAELKSNTDYNRWLIEPGLKVILLHLYRYQGKYVEPIRKILDTYNSLHR